jgi:hypothetical protein
MIDIGPLPEGYTLQKPSSKYDIWDGTQWVEDLVIKEQKEKEEYNNQIKAEIMVKELDLIRPMRELLCTTTPDESKTIAQNKINTIEEEIIILREQLL